MAENTRLKTLETELKRLGQRIEEVFDETRAERARATKAASLKFDDIQASLAQIIQEQTRSRSPSGGNSHGSNSGVDHVNRLAQHSRSPELDPEFYLRQPLCCCAPQTPISPSFPHSHLTSETINLGDFVVVTLYPNGEMDRDSGGIWFRSATPVVFQMQPLDTLEELKAVILRNMGVAGGTSLFKFKIFWVDGDVHVRGIFNLHRRYRTREVMELLAEMQTVDAYVGGPSSSAGDPADVIPCSPIHCAAPGASMQLGMNSDEGSDEDFVGETDDSTESSDGTEFVPESQCRRNILLPTPAPIPDLSFVSSHFHMLQLHDMREEAMEGFGGGGDDYDVAGGEKFKVGHRFSTREAVQMAVKNYSIRRV
ncbi:hypothetical protein PIB30_064398 [Stylosanthes scabra]|uniref:Uncharacterized protein n=1 Tax=Stylosanthes scabra TaxID=79078 RepID=A0ABU6TLG5_9FABA|nr:hypothetical protein [Stylosanthes scabra]